MRGAVVWLGLPDPFKSVDLVSKDDPDKSDLAVALHYWESAIGLGEITTAKVIAKACDMIHNSMDNGGFAIRLCTPNFTRH